MIEVKELTMRFGHTLAVDRVSFNVGKGEILGLLGPNGAGKTTTMRMMMTLLVPTSGTATLGGFDVRERPLDVRRVTGYLPETAPLYPDREVVEYLRFAAKARGLSGKRLKERIGWVVDACGLKDVYRKPITDLSRGFRQRTGLAQALLHDPQILILDEPTSGLDPIQVQTIRSLLRGLAQEKTIIFSTHVMQEVEAISTRVILIHEGRVVADGEIEDLRERACDRARAIAVVKAAAGEARKAAEDAGGFTSVRAEPAQDGWARIEVEGPVGEGLAERLGRLIQQRGWAVREVRPESPSLEETFLAYTRRKEGSK